MDHLNKDIKEGISNLKCDDDMKSFLKEILNYELELYNKPGKTKKTISEEYNKHISVFSEED
ncbi:hypothetical protein [Methanobrevibacter millerae]|uniref:Uncharacterized protein n=1 Tax=Methanobrevibacter millerae TaxID=230361 RepID=A0A1G5X571_9EURY|nr:hypothetical protein [Methanobrevibacter millerae]SDA65086.1 hypothetical protein SAMN02910315_01941 [Methanobrevibacter millerae]